MSDLPPEIQRLSTAEKQALVYAIWEAIAEEASEHVLPDWHLEVLEERERLADSGVDPLIPWEMVKSDLHALAHAD